MCSEVSGLNTVHKHYTFRVTLVLNVVTRYTAMQGKRSAPSSKGVSPGWSYRMLETLVAPTHSPPECEGMRFRGPRAKRGVGNARNWDKKGAIPILICFYTSCSDISQKLPQKCSKLSQKFLISRKRCSKVAFYQLKKSVSTTDESKSLHIYTNHLLIYICLSTR